MSFNTTSDGFQIPLQESGTLPFTFDANYQLPCDSLPFGTNPFDTLCLECTAIIQPDAANKTQATKRRRLVQDSSSSYTNVFQGSHLDPCWPYEPLTDLTSYKSLDMAPNQSSNESIMTPALSLVSPLAKKIFDLGSLLCPCCGREKQAGYYLVPDTQDSALYLDQPYMAEKAPTTSADFSGYSYDAAGLPSYPISSTDETSIPPNHSFAPLSHGTHSNQAPTAPYTNVQNFAGTPAYVNSQPSLIPINASSQFSYNSNPGQHASVPPYPPYLTDGSTDGSPGSTGTAVYGLSPPTTHEAFQPNFPPPLHTSQMGFRVGMELVPGQRNGKRGPFRDPKLRLQTAETRKIGSCVRCKMQRIRCENDPNDPLGTCLTCEKVTRKKVGRFPCLRYKITDIQMFRPGQVPGFEWSRRWLDNMVEPIQHWASDETRTIRLSEGYSSKGLLLTVRQFVPIVGDKLERSWVYKGVKKSVKVPPFAVVDTAAVRQAYHTYITESMEETITTIMEESSPLLKEVYTQTWKESTNSSNSMEILEIVRLSLRLWTSIRMTTKSTFIVGDDSLGMPRDILDDTSPTPGKIPLPPVMGAQLESVLIRQIQSNLRRDLLEKFQRFILKNKASNWFATFLVTAILLHNTSLIIAHDASYAIKHGINRRFAREEMVKEYHLGANILLAHFHYCNKGDYPFSEACSAMSLQRLGKLTEEKVKAVQRMKAFIRMQEKTWSQMWEGRQYENELFYVSQLFEEGWSPRAMSVDF